MYMIKKNYLKNRFKSLFFCKIKSLNQQHFTLLWTQVCRYSGVCALPLHLILFTFSSLRSSHRQEKKQAVRLQKSLTLVIKLSNGIYLTKNFIGFRFQDTCGTFTFNS